MAGLTPKPPLWQKRESTTAGLTPEFSRPGAPEVLLFDGALKAPGETPGR